MGSFWLAPAFQNALTPSRFLRTPAWPAPNAANGCRSKRRKKAGFIMAAKTIPNSATLSAGINRWKKNAPVVAGIWWKKAPKIQKSSVPTLLVAISKRRQKKQSNIRNVVPLFGPTNVIKLLFSIFFSQRQKENCEKRQPDGKAVFFCSK